MSAGHDETAGAGLPDGRAIVIGGYDDVTESEGSVEVLAADGSGWSALAPMGTARHGLAAATLPCGKVLVAGGDDGTDNLYTAELWDPATGAWSDLPPMGEERAGARCCALPSGRLAVVGGYYAGYRCDAEALDPVTRTWQPLPPMAHARYSFGLVAVAGGLVAVGAAEAAPNELFDEASGRWFELPHPMAQPRGDCSAVSLPAAGP